MQNKSIYLSIYLWFLQTTSFTKPKITDHNYDVGSERDFKMQTSDSAPLNRAFCDMLKHHTKRR